MMHFQFRDCRTKSNNNNININTALAIYTTITLTAPTNTIRGVLGYLGFELFK